MFILSCNPVRSPAFGSFFSESGSPPVFCEFLPAGTFRHNVSVPYPLSSSFLPRDSPVGLYFPAVFFSIIPFRRVFVDLVYSHRPTLATLPNLVLSLPPEMTFFRAAFSDLFSMLGMVSFLRLLIRLASYPPFPLLSCGARLA